MTLSQQTPSGDPSHLTFLIQNHHEVSLLLALSLFFEFNPVSANSFMILGHPLSEFPFPSLQNGIFSLYVSLWAYFWEVVP